MDLFRRTIQISKRKCNFSVELALGSCIPLARSAMKPTHRRIIVVRSGIGDAVDRIVMWQIERFAVPIAKSKLDNFHAREMKTISKLTNFVGDKS